MAYHTLHWQAECLSISSQTTGYLYRMGDHDARCGPASIQQFDGEDLAAAERSQTQHQQCYDWWEAQRAQHEAQKAAQAELALREQEAVQILVHAQSKLNIVMSDHKQAYPKLTLSLPWLHQPCLAEHSQHAGSCQTYHPASHTLLCNSQLLLDHPAQPNSGTAQSRQSHSN